MFGKLAGDLAGTSDNCAFVNRSSIASESGAQYLLRGEIPFAYLKSLKTENIFTSTSYISIEGGAAAGTKRLVKRYEFTQEAITNVMWETSGVGLTDQDCELKFDLGGQQHSIDLKKQEAAKGIILYRALVDLSRTQFELRRQVELLSQDRARASNFHLHIQPATEPTASASGVFSALSASSEAWVDSLMSRFYPQSFAFVFERHDLP